MEVLYTISFTSVYVFFKSSIIKGLKKVIKSVLLGGGGFYFVLF